MRNFKNIIEDLKTFIGKHKQVKSFGVGDIKQLSYFVSQIKDENGDLIDNQPDNHAARFPLVYIIPGVVNRDRRTKTYNLNILVMDILSENYSNEVDVWSDTLQIAEDIIAQYGYSVESSTGNYYDDYEIVMPMTLQPFSESFDDYVNGWNLGFQVLINEPIDRCITPTDSFDTNNILQEDDFDLLLENGNNLIQ